MTLDKRTQLTREGIIEFLSEKSVCGCADARTLADALGTISQRMIRNFVAAGELKPLPQTQSYYIFEVNEVANWLMKYPRYLFKNPGSSNDMSAERFTALSNMIRDYCRQKFPAILKFMDIEDVVMEVVERISKRRHSNADVSDSTLVFRAICSLYKREKNKVQTVTIAPHEIEKIYEGNDDDEN